jgi:hypothetical protein
MIKQGDRVRIKHETLRMNPALSILTETVRVAGVIEDQGVTLVLLENIRNAFYPNALLEDGQDDEQMQSRRAPSVGPKP